MHILFWATEASVLQKFQPLPQTYKGKNAKKNLLKSAVAILMRNPGKKKKQYKTQKQPIRTTVVKTDACEALWFFGLIHLALSKLHL